MKLNVNPKELLALHNVLYERFEDNRCHDENKDDSGTIDEVQLRQIYNRLRAIIVASLISYGKVVDPVDSWFKHEQLKIDDLQQQNESLKEAVHDPGFFVPPKPESILTDDDGEVSSDLSYPSCRKGAPFPNAPYHKGKHRGRRK